MGTATFGQQTKALVQKSWTYQKRNMGSNICLCVAPIFFCVILAVIQGVVNVIFLNSDNLKCGCFCEQCCPSWALKSSPGNFTTDGQGNITIANVATFGGYAAIASLVPPSFITNNTDGSVTVRTCAPVASGPCPGDLGYTCLKTDKNTCGIQFSLPQQAQWCAVPQPSSWPAVLQIPGLRRRAKPWGATNVTTGNRTVTVPRTATLVTGLNSQLQSSVSQNLFPATISNNVTLWAQALLGPGGLNAGNATDPNLGNIYNGYWLSLLGFLFGTDANPQFNVYIEGAFQQGQNLNIMLPIDACVSRNIPTSIPKICLADFLRLWFAQDASVNTTLLPQLPPCSSVPSGNPNELLSTLQLQVLCAEAQVVPTPTSRELEDQLFCGYYQARCPNTQWTNNMYQGAFDFTNTTGTALNVNVYYNETISVVAGGAPAYVLRLPGPLNQAITSWWNTITASIAGFASQASPELLGIMSMPKPESKLTLDFASILGPLFFTWVVQLLLPTFLQQLVYEKEKRLRMMMKMHGLGDRVYWIVTYLWYLILYIIYIIIFIVIGIIARLNMFRKTSIGIQIIFYFLHGLCMISFAFMLSSLFASSRTAIMVAFLYVFATGLIGQLLLEPFMIEDKLWVFFVEWIPAFALYRGLWEMSAYTQIAVYRGTRGMTFANLADSGNGMVATWAIFIVEWALFLIVGLYFEQVISSGTGVRKHPLFFLQWCWKKKAEPIPTADTDHRSSIDGKMEALQHSVSVKRAESRVRDVDAERQRVEALTDYSDTPILVNNVQKIYPGLDGGPPKTAVRQMTLGVSRGECFGLLGPNGAGKTTLINVLIGFLEPSRGTALIEGLDIRSKMNEIYHIMGVCPQHDLLWEELSGREHLRFYGRLKGLMGRELEDAVDDALKAVNLYNGGVGNKFAGKYSGGMKRRLSLAISFIGTPKVVYLDEPSTGLDPASRRNLWDVVRANKEGRSIILTTHSMEEAETLCDRLGIFVNGQLICLGNPKEITSRYAGFLVFSISVPPEQVSDAKKFVSTMSPNSVLTYELGGTLKYELPCSDVALSEVFSHLNAAKANLHVIDWGVSNATLEEVFIKLAKIVGDQKDH